MKELETPAAIVAQAESATDLPGLRKLCSALKAETIFARNSGAEARFKRLEIVRQLCTFGERADVKTEIEALNKKQRQRPGYTGGRPFSGRTLAAQELAKVAGISEKTLYRWLAEWTEFAALLSVETTTPKTLTELAEVNCHSEKQPLADWLDSVDATAATQGTKPNAFEQITDPRKFQAVVYHKIENMFHATGNAVLQARGRLLWAEVTESWWASHGVEVEIVFAPRKEKSRR